MKPYQQSNVYIDYDARYNEGYSDGKKAGIEKVKADLAKIIDDCDYTSGDVALSIIMEYLKK